MNKLFVLVAAILTTGALAACESTFDSNYLANKTYRATDRLITQTEARVSQSTPILVTTLNDVDYMETSNTLGRAIAEQVASRLTQKGYNVKELKLRNSLNIKRGLEGPIEGGEYILTRDIKALRGEHKSSTVVTGTYAVAGQQVLVNLKMIDVATGKIAGSTDYVVPLEANTRRLLGAGGSNSMNFYGESMAYN